MDIRVVLSKILTLIYRARLVNNIENDDLIRTVLATVKTDSPEFSFGNTNTPKRLKDFCIELLEDKEPIAKEVILPRLHLLLEKDAKLHSSIQESIETDYDDSSNKRIITSLIKNLYNYYRESQATEIIGKISYDIKFNRTKIANFNDYLRDAMGQLEPFTLAHTTLKDPGIVNEVDFESPESVAAIFEEVKKLNSDTGVYRLGLQGLNRIFSGGIRRGECIGIEALQHKFKSGTCNMILTHIPLFNAPIMTKDEIEQKKKPLILRISLEDPISNTLESIYQYLRSYNKEPISKKELQQLSSKEMADYVVPKLTATGFHIKMMRVDPNQWTYSSIINKVIELEAQGYSIHVLLIDYLFKLPTTGCSQGPAGFDKRDLVRRMRNFCSARGIACISPFQLSTEAVQLLRNGVPEHDFVNVIAEKNYTDSCKTVGQELDLELYVHLFKHKRKTYLAFRRGKHRITQVLSDEHKFCMYQFPDINTPILPDVDMDDTSFQKLPRGDGGGSGSELLEDILG